MKQILRNIAMRPEYLFLLFAIPFGILGVLLLPPLMGSDEFFHFQRVASIAAGYWTVEPAMVPAGIVEFLNKTYDIVNENGAGGAYTAARLPEIFSIPLMADSRMVMNPSPVTIHSAANYIPQLAAYWAGYYAETSPAMLLYLMRFAGLSASLWITYHAIRIMPSWRYTLCGLALLPPLSLFRSYLNTDAMVDATGMFLLAYFLREIKRAGAFRYSDSLQLMLLAVLVAFCKFPYAIVTLLAVVIPATRFASLTSRILNCALMIIPSVLAGLLWVEISRHGVLQGLQYDTWGGHAYPDGQLDYILHNPASFAGVLFATLSSASFYGYILKEMFGHFGSMAQASPVYYLTMFALFAAMAATDRTAAESLYPRGVKIMIVPIITGFVLVTLTALYIHWSGLKAETVAGFQGRYFYPLMPLLLLVLPRPAPRYSGQVSAIVISMFAATGLIMALVLLLAQWR